MDNILCVVNGMAMYERYVKKELEFDGEVVPFNEAMCDGEGTKDIFGSEFILERALVHGVGAEEYEDIVITPLLPFFQMEYNVIELFFDADMFCQINLLTILAYLDKNEFNGEVILYHIDENHKLLNTVKIKVDGFYRVYLDVVIDRKLPDCVLPEILLDGCINYLSYKKEDNEIKKFILENLDMEESALLEELFYSFSQYGLGDAQYLKMIEMLKY